MKNILKSILGAFKKPKEVQSFPMIYINEEIKECESDFWDKENWSVRNRKNPLKGREKMLDPIERKQCELQRIAHKTKKFRIIKKLGKRIANLSGPY